MRTYQVTREFVTGVLVIRQPSRSNYFSGPLPVSHEYQRQKLFAAAMLHILKYLKTTSQVQAHPAVFFCTRLRSMCFTQAQKSIPPQQSGFKFGSRDRFVSRQGCAGNYSSTVCRSFLI